MNSPLARFNIAFGFFVIGLISCAGAVMSFDVTDAIVRDPQTLLAWKAILQKSAHAHGNLFGMLHILFGMTLQHSLFSHRVRLAQTGGFLLGSLAAGPLMWVRSFSSAPDETMVLTYILSVFFVAALVAIFSHSLGVFLSLKKRV